MSTIILVLWAFSLTVIELSALLNDITGSFLQACSYVARTLLRRFFGGLCSCRFWLKVDSAPCNRKLSAMPYQFAAVASAVDCPAFVRAVAILSATYVGFTGSFWLLRLRSMGIGFSFVPLAIRSESCVAFSSLLASVIVQDRSRASPASLVAATSVAGS